MSQSKLPAELTEHSSNEATASSTSVLDQSPHEIAAHRIGGHLPHFLDPDIVKIYKPVYLVADYLHPTTTRANYLLKYTIYKLLLPFDYFWIWRISTWHTPEETFIILQELRLNSALSQ